MDTAYTQLNDQWFSIPFKKNAKYYGSEPFICLAHLELKRTQIPVQAIFIIDQLLVTTRLDDPAFLQNYNIIRLTDGGKAVSDNYRCASLHEFFQCFLHQTLGFGGRWRAVRP